MASIFGFDTGVSVPVKLSSQFGGTLTILLFIIVLGVVAAIGVFIWVNSRTFNKKIIIFENIAGQGYQPIFKDRARLVKIGDGGEELLFLKKMKVYRTAYGKKMGKNTYWFAKGQDGYHYNILLGDLDAKMGMLDIEPIDRDMRYMHVAIRKNIQERYRKIGFMEKFGVMLFSGIFFLIMIFALWFLIDQIGDLVGTATASIEAAKPIVEASNQILGKIDTICAGGSGLEPAT